MLAKKPVVLENEGLGSQPFHGRIALLVDRHTASAAEMIVAFARENGLATIIGEKTAGRLLSATSVKVGMDSTSRSRRDGDDRHLNFAIECSEGHRWRGPIKRP
jgi:C-terminal processing protease CtpA/Prc